MTAPLASPLRIFISHKHHDGRDVAAIAAQLERYARRRKLECFVSDYDIRGGQDWRQRIRRELRRSNMLLLFYTDPTSSWDWCLYEAGLFSRLDAERVKPIVCVYAGDRPPGPLHNLQGVRAHDIDALKRFLKRLYTSTELFVPGYSDPDATDAPLPLEAAMAGADVTLNDRIREQTLTRLATTIRDRIYRRRRTYPCHRLVLEMPDPLTQEARPLEQSLARAGVVDATAGTLRSIFGRDRSQGSTWGDLVRSIDSLRPQRWARELADRLIAVASGDVGDTIFQPITTTFRGRDGRIYCPELYRVDLSHGNGTVSSGPWTPSRVVVLFDSLNAPSVVGDTVFNLIRANFRFREEVFAQFAGRLGAMIASERRELAPREDEARRAVLQRLEEALDLIDHEADLHGFFDPARLAEAYGEATERWQRVQSLCESWLTTTKRLRKAIQQGDIDAAEERLSELSALNCSFSVIAAEQHLEMMRKEIGQVQPESRERVPRRPPRCLPPQSLTDKTGSNRREAAASSQAASP